MNWADYAILVVIGISAVISIFRGFVREVLSIVAWILAFWVAFVFAQPCANLLTDMISVPSVRYIAAFLFLLVVTLILSAIVNFLIGKLIDKTGLSGTDRVLGVLFGLVRGIAVVGVIVILLRATPATGDPWWGESFLLPHFDALALFVLDFFPDSIAQYFR